MIEGTKTKPLSSNRCHKRVLIPSLHSFCLFDARSMQEMELWNENRMSECQREDKLGQMRSRGHPRRRDVATTRPLQDNGRAEEKRRIDPRRARRMRQKLWKHNTNETGSREHSATEKRLSFSGTHTHTVGFFCLGETHESRKLLWNSYKIIDPNLLFVGRALRITRNARK